LSGAVCLACSPFQITDYRLRVASYEGAKSSPDRLEFVERRFQLRLDVLVQLLFLAGRPEQSSLPRLQPILQFQLVLLHALDWNRIDVSIFDRPNPSHLLVPRDRGEIGSAASRI